MSKLVTLCQLLVLGRLGECSGWGPNWGPSIENFKLLCGFNSSKYSWYSVRTMYYIASGLYVVRTMIISKCQVFEA